MRYSLKIAPCIAAALLIGVSTNGHDAQAQEPIRKVMAPEPYVVSGYRSAKFGMSEAEVGAAIARDFGLPAKDLRRAVNGVDGTTALLARVESLDPAPGPAAISYIFGARSKRLIHVNVVWLAKAEDASNLRPKFVAAAHKLSRYFMSYKWRDNVVISGSKVGQSSLVTFLGKDAKGSAAEVRLDGVLLADSTSGKPLNPDVPLGAVRLRVSYAEKPNTPDVKRVEKGTF